MSDTMRLNPTLRLVLYGFAMTFAALVIGTFAKNFWESFGLGLLIQFLSCFVADHTLGLDRGLAISISLGAGIGVILMTFDLLAGVSTAGYFEIVVASLTVPMVVAGVYRVIRR